MTSKAGGSDDLRRSGAVALVLAPDPAAVRQARTFVKARCQDAGISDDACETAVLLTSEMVTNAFTHGRSEARLAVTVTTGVILVEVGDDNSRHPRPAELDADALDGRGLSIVDTLAADWGVRDNPYGKTVWFQVCAN